MLSILSVSFTYLILIKYLPLIVVDSLRWFDLETVKIYFYLWFDFNFNMDSVRDSLGIEIDIQLAFCFP